MQVLYNSSQTQTREMQVKLDSQKRKRQQLEEEVSASQAHIAELTAILKSAVRSNSVSGPTGSQSPRSAALSREASGGEVGPRLRSKELQGAVHSINCWTVSAWRLSVLLRTARGISAYYWLVTNVFQASASAVRLQVRRKACCSFQYLLA